MTSALVYALNTLFVGLFGELLLRGYAQYSLTTGIGFWAAAILPWVGFGALVGMHAGLDRGDSFFSGAIPFRDTR